jgi:hypothetical protein
LLSFKYRIYQVIIKQIHFFLQQTCYAADGTEFGTTYAESIRPYIPSHEQIPLNAFLYLGKQVMGMSSPNEVMEYYWRVFAGGGAELSKDGKYRSHH